MSQDEHLPEELNEELTDTERKLVTLAPRASRIDRDRLMLRLGQQSVAHSSTPWKWATAASLLLALGLAVRPAFVPTASGPAEIAIQSEPATPPASVTNHPEPLRVASPANVQPVHPEPDWLAALSSGRFDFTRPLTVRPELALADPALRSAEVATRDEANQPQPSDRQPMLRWGDERRKRSGEAILPRT